MADSAPTAGLRGDLRRTSAAPAQAPMRFGNPVFALLLVAGAVALIMQERQFRSFEAAVTAPLLRLILEGGTAHHGESFYIGIGAGDVHRIVITSLCSTAVLFVPLLVIAAFLLFLPRFRVLPTLAGLGVAIVIAAVANLARYALASWALQAYGQEAFDIVHRWIGSVLVIGAFALAFFVFVRIAARGRREQ